uniref:peptidylprolyl isomerase n=1 Tax=Ditylum brightwellii TaxID=49249 RepID=A0A7S4V8S5_9STRA
MHKVTQTIALLISCVSYNDAFTLNHHTFSKKSISALQMNNNDDASSSSSSRRSFLSTTVTAATAFSLLTPLTASAGIDPSALKNLAVEGDNSGTLTRLRQIEAVNDRPEDNLNLPWNDLSSGVSYREYREGKGEASVTKGSRVAVEMTIRCKSFATANDPGGVKYFSTKEDTDFNELAWTVGSGALPAGLEEGMEGMHKGGLRRIEVPSTMVFAARKDGSLPVPSEKNKDGKRVFDRLFKTDATLLFEVLVTRIK